MQPSINDLKSQLRQQCKAIRKDLGDENRQRASAAICNHLSAWDVFQASGAILTYMPMRSEVDLRSLLAAFPGKRWLLPRILPEEDHRMVFHPYDPDHLIQHSFGMAEPSPHLPQIPPGEIQLVLVPGLAFDCSGWRLGYGGGYFDRFLKDFGGVSVGVVFQALLLEALPHGDYDVPMQWLATEAGLVNTRESRTKNQPVSNGNAPRGSGRSGSGQMQL
jgi:5-formyltetrahydrofolate cyclo-ligase